MKLNAVKHAYKLFNNPLASKSTIRHNVKAYLLALEYLGNKWILFAPVKRK